MIRRGQRQSIRRAAHDREMAKLLRKNWQGVLASSGLVGVFWLIGFTSAWEAGFQILVLSVAMNAVAEARSWPEYRRQVRDLEVYAMKLMIEKEASR